MPKAETVRRGQAGKIELRLVHSEGRYHGMADGKPIVIGADADDVWRRLHNEVGRADSRYFGFDGARNRFLHWFEGGFRSERFLAEERDYKVRAKAKLDASAPVEAAATGSGFREAALSAFRATNLLSPFEKTRLTAMLRSPEADAFVRGAAHFALGEVRNGLAHMQAASKPHDSAKWTVATYLPFLWRPESHMFLKPEVTKDFAVRVGHCFARDYQAGLHPSVYDSLLDLTEETCRELSSLEPRDRIDVQSFIWVIGDYAEGRETPAP
ncbi:MULTISPECIES: hypothetical protein [unclassified Methylobacterium]|uniref:hypothetical protein n=1 Tax=unclassified Methylobacterium TaxID=2615210 RepID=UPI0036F52B32